MCVALPMSLLGKEGTVGSCYPGPHLYPEPVGGESVCALQRGTLYTHVHTACGHASHSERCQANHLPCDPNLAENVHLSWLKRPRRVHSCQYQLFHVWPATPVNNGLSSGQFSAPFGLPL